ncbi:LysR family transcriptional regulator [Serratia rubidaea]|nr:LysR family transcriptional regulator [Serratia rubidaea]
MLKHWSPLNSLHGFEVAARLGSLHRAAKKLHLTQSALSPFFNIIFYFLQKNTRPDETKE